MTIFFKLKKANASTKLAHFSEKPSWEDLTYKIARLFNIPSNRVGLASAFVEKEVPITLSSEDELQDFYKYKSSEVIDLVVQDTLAPDSECTFQCLTGLIDVSFVYVFIAFAHIHRWLSIPNDSISLNHFNFVTRYQSV